MMRFNPEVKHVPGKNQIIADALSRAPASVSEDADISFITEVETFASYVLHALPATPKRLQDIKEAQKADEECMQIREYCLHGWPTYMPHMPLLRQYWESRSHLAVVDDILLYEDRIVIPRSMRLEMLDRIHQGHLGITKCRARARAAVWWPGLSKSIEDMVTKCSTCAKDRPETKQPLMPSSLPDRPWERLGTDLFHFNGKNYLIVIDYYSRWVEIKRLAELGSEAVITTLKELFSVHGIPDVMVSDTGPQFSAETFRKFAATYGFVHVTSSPLYPASNGEAERAVRTVKGLLRKNEDPYLALLTYRSTPLQNGLSPSELLMGRRLRTQLPVLPRNLQPQSHDLKSLRDKEDTYRQNQECNFNKRHRAKDLPILNPGDQVWIRDQKRDGQIVDQTAEPRSYLVKTAQGTVRRNRSALVQQEPTSINAQPPASTPIVPPASPPPEKPVQCSPIKTRSGRVVKPNPKYSDYLK
jgi:transposase InsO family protein